MSVGYLYVMYSPSIGYYKIGITMRSVEERLREANSNTWSIPDFEIKLFKKVHNAEARELTLHKIFDAYRVHPKREFFDVPLDMIQLHFDLMDEVEDETKQQDIYTKFLDEHIYPLDENEGCTVPWSKIEDHFQQWKKCNDINRGNIKDLKKLLEDTYGKPVRGIWESQFKFEL
jgi:hypothetical protein